MEVGGQFYMYLWEEHRLWQASIRSSIPPSFPPLSRPPFQKPGTDKGSAEECQHCHGAQEEGDVASTWG